MARLDRLDRVEVASRADLRAWLAAQHGRDTAVWLVTFRKTGAMAGRHLPYAEVVDELLSFGWIDSLPRKLDADHTMLLIAPRRPGSSWSAINKAKVERLIADGLMTDAGLARIAAAKADGSWTALDAVETLAEPADLTAALDADPAARTAWDGFARSSRRGILEWIAAARKPETRAARIAETARLAALGKRANHPVDRA